METELVTFEDFKEVVHKYVNNEITDEEMLKWCSTHWSKHPSTQALLETWVRAYGND